MRGLITHSLAELTAPTARAGWLELHDIGTVSCQMHAAIGPCYALAEVQDFEPFES